MFDAKVILDSISPAGVRLTTMEVTFPRMILAEFNTHRVFSRNSASSRAIPVEKMLHKVIDDTFIPVYWGKNQKGMQAEQELTLEEQIIATNTWLTGRDLVVAQVNKLLALGVHKQIANRLLEPWLFHTVLVSATEWENFFALRTDKNAQPEMQAIAKLMLWAYETSEPKQLDYGHWHMPLMPDLKELEQIYGKQDLLKISIGRCARVSYLTHHGARDPMVDIDLCCKLIASGHMSPTEHVARPLGGLDSARLWSGNFRGWEQYRKTIKNEANFGARRN